MTTPDPIGAVWLHYSGTNIRSLFVCGAVLVVASVTYAAGLLSVHERRTNVRVEQFAILLFHMNMSGRMIADEPFDDITATSDSTHLSNIVRMKNWLWDSKKNRFGKPPLQRTRSDGQGFKSTRQRRVLPRRRRFEDLFEQLLEIFKHGVLFVRPRAISEKELLAQVQCLSLHCSGTKPDFRSRSGRYRLPGGSRSLISTA
jgi:hypothetical protein